MLLSRDELPGGERAGGTVYIIGRPRFEGLRGRPIGPPRGELGLSLSRGTHVRGGTRSYDLNCRQEFGDRIYRIYKGRLSHHHRHWLGRAPPNKFRGHTREETPDRWPELEHMNKILTSITKVDPWHALSIYLSLLSLASCPGQGSDNAQVNLGAELEAL